MNLENFIKGPLTSIFGFLIMVTAGVCWLLEYLTDAQAMVFGGVGFALLFMRDKLPGFVTQFFQSKFGGNNNQPPSTPTALLIMAFASITMLTSAQTDATMVTNANTIKNETHGGANTATRIGNAFLDLANGKLNKNAIPEFTVSGTNTYTVTGVTLETGTLVSGQKVIAKFPNANTSSATLNINSLGAKPIVKKGSTALSSGDISANQWLFLKYDGTNFQIIGDGGGGGGSLTDGNATTANGTAVDLGGGMSDDVDINDFGGGNSIHIGNAVPPIDFTISVNNDFAVSASNAVSISSNAGGMSISATGDGLGAGNLEIGVLSGALLNINGASQTVIFGDGYGLKYGSDYSGTFVNRSLIDLGYANSHYVTGAPSDYWKTTGTSTLSSTSATDIKLVYTGSANTELVFHVGTGGELAGDSFQYFNVQTGTPIISTVTNSTGSNTKFSNIDFTGGLLRISSTNASGKLVKLELDANGTEPTAIITDSRTTKTGLVYAADYSASYTSRSLVDFGSVKDAAYTFTNKTISGSSNTITNISLTTAVTGILPSANGGAGTINGILKANGSGTVSLATAGTDYLTPSGSGASLTGVYRLASGGTFTGANTLTGTSTNTLKLAFASLGTTITYGAGAYFQNSTAATVGSSQISPIITLEGQGWKTNTTAGSQSVAFYMYNLPVQGAANPTGLLKIGANVNAGGNSDIIQVDSRGYIGLNAAPTLGTMHVTGISGQNVFYFRGAGSAQGVILEDGGFVFRPIASGNTASGTNSTPWTITYSQRVIVDNSGSGQITGTTFQSNPSAYTNSTASTERIDNYFNGARTVNFNTGAMTLQRFNVFGAPTISANGASTFTRNVNVSIGGAPKTGTNVTTTTTIGLEVETSAVVSAGEAYGAYLNAPSGGTKNYALGISGITLSNNDFVLSDATKGLVLKDSAGTPHYWRVTVNTSGVLVVTDLGTTIP